MSRRRGLGDCWSGTEAVSSPHAHCLRLCVCLCARLWIWLRMLWVWEGNVFVLVSQTTVWSAIYGGDGSLPRHLYKIDFEFHSSLGFLCVTVHSPCVQGRYCMSSAYLTFPRHFTEECIWTWDWALWIILSLTIWLFTVWSDADRQSLP